MSEPLRGTGTASMAAGPAHTCERSFRATADQVGEARRFLAQILGDWPLTADAVACLSELAANSVRHSSSRRPGGCFTVRASLRPECLRVEVEDEGGAWGHRQEPEDECGRGFVIVGALASDWSITGTESTRTIWFELGLHTPAPAADGRP